ncbi:MULTISPECIES: M23 family metallopeptidase [Subtercola]|uniref:M23 family metallopeptidase n=1 Tax=Subtercola vilae TaxID=2056433 RepID=A0A4T2C852_9MICO|nr:MULTISPECIES: M23 family metallopeptidase [Subtercola]MEA9984938.1 M23 family metallopeptidase [Subtercola sp. RTI3]TIH40407.1 M23 family metallopeptidase [Subtercola vilae]
MNQANAAAIATDTAPATDPDAAGAPENAPRRPRLAHRSRQLLRAAVLSLALVMGEGLAPEAAHAVEYPSWEDVLEARSNEATKEGEIASIRSLIAGLETESTAARALADQRGAEYETAQIAFDAGVVQSELLGAKSAEAALGELRIAAERSLAAAARAEREARAAAEAARAAAASGGGNGNGNGGGNGNGSGGAAGGSGSGISGPGTQVWNSPLPNARVSDEFGNRFHPIDAVWRLHAGIDLVSPGGTCGANVYAASAGTVTFAGSNGGLGNAVTINHGGGRTTVYGHNTSLVVRSGWAVAEGQLIAKAGTTGASTGCHVHFETRLNGTAQNPRAVLAQFGAGF